MKLVQFSNSNKQYRSLSFYPKKGNQAEDISLQPQADSGCVNRCVGSSAAVECAHCGNDYACWDQCAGSGKGSCVKKCDNPVDI